MARRALAIISRGVLTLAWKFSGAKNSGEVTIDAHYFAQIAVGREERLGHSIHHRGGRIIAHEAHR